MKEIIAKIKSGTPLSYDEFLELIEKDGWKEQPLDYQLFSKDDEEGEYDGWYNIERTLKADDLSLSIIYEGAFSFSAHDRTSLKIRQNMHPYERLPFKVVKEDAELDDVDLWEDLEQAGFCDGDITPLRELHKSKRAA